MHCAHQYSQQPQNYRELEKVRKVSTEEYEKILYNEENKVIKKENKWYKDLIDII